MSDLHDLQTTQGAQWIDSDDRSIAASFGNDSDARQAIAQAVVVCDRSHWSRIEVSDSDRIRFLHNQTTNDFMLLQPGQGCDTVFVTSTGRTIDLATAYVLPDRVLLLVSPGQAAALIQWMDRYIFFADKVKLTDVTPTTATFSLMGAESDRLIAELGANNLIDQPYAAHQPCTVDGTETFIAKGSGLTIPGYTLVVPQQGAATVWQYLTHAGAVPMGDRLWQQLRVEQGRPLPAHELTEQYNPLEAGLWHTISLSKGCYIGQETIARLHTYRGVKQQLWGLKLDAPAAVGSPVMAGDEKIGQLTSCTQTDEGAIALAYIRTKAIEAGVNRVQVESAVGELVALPFVNHTYP